MDKIQDSVIFYLVFFLNKLFNLILGEDDSPIDSIGD